MKRLLIIVASVVLAGSLAQAARANLAPNPGFEDGCGILLPHPCYWSPYQGTAAIDRVTSPKHGGSWSLRVVPTGPGFGGAQSDCFAATPGTYTMSYYSLFSDAGIGAIWGGISFFSDATCSTPIAGQGVQQWANFTRGAWQQAGGTATAPAGTRYALIYLEPSCAVAACDGTSAAYFDDVDLEQLTMTAVRVLSFTVAHSANGALLRWRTASEVDVLGFNVYRDRAGRRVKLNPGLIAAKGLAGRGASYRYLDAARRGTACRYRLQVVNLDGSRSWAGSTIAR